MVEASPRIRIQNVYWMLAYAFQCLNEGEAKEYSREEFDNLLSLFGRILANGLAKQVKQGLSREYRTYTETSGRPRGQILIPETMLNAARHQKLAVCNVDEYAEDSYPNRILKSTAMLLSKQPEIDETVRRDLLRQLAFFSKVGTADLRHVSWNRLSYNRNNRSYRMLMAICRLIIDGMIISTDKDKVIRLREYIDDSRMYDLYEKFLLEFFKRHFPFLSVTHSQIDWALGPENRTTDYLPIMQSDLMLSYKHKTLIIDAKYYEDPLTRRFQGSKPVLHSGNLYQIYTYVNNLDTSSSGDVSGMLLYIKSDGPSPDADYMMRNNRISAKTLDMDCPFEDIKSQLFALAEGWLSYALPEESLPSPRV